MLPTTHRYRSALAIAAGAAIALALPGCKRDDKPAPAPVPEVTVLTLRPASVPLSVDLPGRTAPFLLAEVRARVDGIVQERSFVEGADVRQGQPLYRIDPAPYQAALASARAALQRAEANLATAGAKLKRYDALVGSNAISKQEYDDAKADQQQAAADVAGATAAATTARINLGYTSVSAPIGGRSTVSQVTKGAYVQGGSATLLTTIQQIDPMYVDLQQSSVEGLALRREIAAGNVRMDGPDRARVTLTLEDGSTYARTGTLEVSGVNVDPATGSVTLRARFPNPEHLLLPGMFVHAAVSQGVRQNALRVPAPAVTRNQQGQATVMLVGADGKTVQRTIRTGALVDGQWLVDEGLKDGERVVVSGVQKLRPGVAVKVREATPSAAPAAPATAMR